MLILLAAFMTAAPERNVDIADGLGVNIQFVTPPPGTLAKIREAGFRWVRFDLNWEQVEKKKGSYDFSRYDVLIRALRGENLRPLAILDYGNALYGDGVYNTPDRRAAYAAFTGAVAKHFSGQSMSYEIWNEPNTQKFWKGPPSSSEYTALFHEAATAIHAASPNDKVIGPAASDFDWKFLTGCFKAGLLRDADAISVHPYRPTAPETAYGDYKRLQRLIAKSAPNGKTIPVWCSEVGYARTTGMSERTEAAYAIRERLAAAAAGVPVTIHYRWSDPAGDNQEPIGLITGSGKETPALEAVRRFATLTAGYWVSDFSVVSERGAMLAKLTNESGETRTLAWSTHNASLALPLATATDISALEGEATSRATGSASIGAMPVSVNSESVGGLLSAPRPAGVQKRIVRDLGTREAPDIALGAWGQDGLMAIVEASPDANFDGTIKASCRGNSSSQSVKITAGKRKTLTLKGLGTSANGQPVKIEFVVSGRSIDTAQFRPVWCGQGGSVALRANVRPTARTVGITPESLAQSPSPVLEVRPEETNDAWSYLTLDAAPAPKAENDDELTIIASCDKDAAFFRCRFVDGLGRTFQPAGQRIEPGRLAVIHIPLNGVGTAHWGGSGGTSDDAVSGEVSVVSPVLIDVGQSKNSGLFNIAGIWIRD